MSTTAAIRKEEKEIRIKNAIEAKIREIWPEYEIKNAEFNYQLRQARADKRRANKFKNTHTKEELKDIYLCTYTHYINENECTKTTLTLYTALNLTAYQLAAAYCFNDAALNWTGQEFKNNVLEIK